MRTHISLALLCALVANSIAAQSDEGREEKSNGLRLGYHMSDLSGGEDYDPLHGYYVGYYRNWFKVPLISASAGLEANSAGAELDDTRLRLIYLTMPLNGRLKLGAVYFDLGIDAALKLDEKFIVDGEKADIPDSAEGEAFDVLGHVGAGFKFLFLGVEVRYRHAFTEIYDGYQNTGVQVGLITFFGK